MENITETSLTVAMIFSRSAIELKECVRILREIEMRLSPLMVSAAQNTPDTSTSRVFQDYDLLIQTLEDISLFLHLLAASDQTNMVLEAGHPLSQMRLCDLRQRMSGARTADIPADSHSSLF
jgi:hypothetical protein